MKYQIRKPLREGTIPNYYDFETWYIMQFGYFQYLKTKIRAIKNRHTFTTEVDSDITEEYWRFLG